MSVTSCCRLYACHKLLQILRLSQAVADFTPVTSCCRLYACHKLLQTLRLSQAVADCMPVTSCCRLYACHKLLQTVCLSQAVADFTPLGVCNAGSLNSHSYHSHAAASFRPLDQLSRSCSKYLRHNTHFHSAKNIPSFFFSFLSFTCRVRASHATRFIELRAKQVLCSSKWHRLTSSCFSLCPPWW